MKKYILTILAVLCVTAMVTMPALAADVSYVMDDADLLTEAEKGVLAETCGAAEDYGCGVYIVTVEDFTVYGKDPYTAAQTIFLQQGLGVGEDADGIMLMLSMADRDYSLIAHGYLGNAVFPDYVKDDIIDGFLDDFRNNDWYGGFTDFVTDCLYELSVYEPATEEPGYEPYEPEVPHVEYEPQAQTLREKIAYLSDGERVVLVAVPLAVALVVCLIMKGQMRTARIATDADAYIPKRGVNLTLRQDTYKYTTTRVIHHERNDSSGGSGGGFSGGGGGFSGRSGKF